MMFTITDFAMKRSGKLHGMFLGFLSTWYSRFNFFLIVHEPKMWDDLKGQFMNHIEQVNKDLQAAGLPPLGTPTKY